MSNAKRFTINMAVGLILYIPTKIYILDPNPTVDAIVGVIAHVFVMYWAIRWIYHGNEAK